MRVVFQSAGQISMTGPRSLYATRFLWSNRTRLNRHHFVPVGPIFVFDQHRQRRAEGQAVTNSAEDLDMIAFDLHARATPVTLLPSPEFMIDLIKIDRDAGGQTFDYRDERATM